MGKKIKRDTRCEKIFFGLQLQPKCHLSFWLCSVRVHLKSARDRGGGWQHPVLDHPSLVPQITTHRGWLLCLSCTGDAILKRSCTWDSKKWQNQTCVRYFPARYYPVTLNTLHSCDPNGQTQTLQAVSVMMKSWWYGQIRLKKTQTHQVLIL